MFSFFPTKNKQMTGKISKASCRPPAGDAMWIGDTIKAEHRCPSFASISVRENGLEMEESEEDLGVPFIKEIRVFAELLWVSVDFQLLLS